ncbi:MAG TPA: helix-hairpin-helix domain-containing protein [Acidobacteriaceae bacterium]|nr:helix-hairpin-helix domain-containing protein [Acidobacteriaceae bacterium]
MERTHKPWLSALFCIGFSAFAVAGCSSAPQVANQSEPSQPAAQSAVQPEAAANKGQARNSDQKAQAKPGQSGQQLSADAQQAASDTEQMADNLLTGLKKDFGHDPYPPSDEIININYSSEERLLTLPGINHDLAMEIIRNRPYATPTDLIAKHVLTQEEFDKIKDRLTAWDNLWNNPND